jgi:hypothetical protein
VLKDGRLVTLVLTESDGAVIGRQNVWVSWDYKVASIIGALSA